MYLENGYTYVASVGFMVGDVVGIFVGVFVSATDDVFWNGL